MSDAPVKPGDVLASKYRVERVLGHGAMGVVVLATHMALDQAVALKFLLPEATTNPEVTGRFMREARLAVKLRSEHVAKVLDVGNLENGAPYIVMEYLNGEDLSQRLEREGPLPIADVAEYVIQACDGLAEAHALGIVHRDLKPANLFLTRRPDGTPLVKVLDFGISKASQLDEGGHGLTKTTAVMGSPYYMSPEQMISSKDVDARSDVWSLGVIVHELLTGRAPFDAETLGGLMSKVLTEAPPVLSLRRADVAPALSNLVAWCMQRDRAQRAPNVAELALGLLPFAPSRAQPIADRIASLLRVVPRSGRPPPMGGSVPPPALATSQAMGFRQSQATALGQSQPSVLGQSQPSVLGQPQPSVLGQSQPSVLGQSQATALGQPQPSVLGQSQATRPSQPAALSQSQATALSRSATGEKKGRAPLGALVAAGVVVVLGVAGLGARQLLLPRAGGVPSAEPARAALAAVANAPVPSADATVAGAAPGSTGSTGAATAAAPATATAAAEATASARASVPPVAVKRASGPAPAAPGLTFERPQPPAAKKKSVLDDRN